MGKLSLKAYAWKCVLGSEVLYAVCLVGGLLPIRSARGIELHHTFFETLPGFTWLTFGSVILGVIYVSAFAWIFGWYYVWMHNSSLEAK
ncbi:MAG: hypothetical protein A3I39_01135 [Candidatus Yanofskybacteria bacterium RIFCSPLOWO2_02_FULL_47_9b]|uniref:Uncharacterized protein n=1 Tax=Candidatus Yanofskybacteria bacterium RIFCSPLOWO2_02_FULL_47_9b TaxID=1802708 RepID=A0A1F8H879_9BACT|nr:MAG: hypothetical protein A3I39_01135 [Candidatus Yanofskybacteria bacterium RIFCSPLOWO2_02_FULL_47_9b]